MIGVSLFIEATTVLISYKIKINFEIYLLGPILLLINSFLLPVALEIFGLLQKSCVLNFCSSGIASALVFLLEYNQHELLLFITASLCVIGEETRL